MVDQYIKARLEEAKRIASEVNLPYQLVFYLNEFDKATGIEGSWTQNVTTVLGGKKVPCSKPQSFLNGQIFEKDENGAFCRPRRLHPNNRFRDFKELGSVKGYGYNTGIYGTPVNTPDGRTLHFGVIDIDHNKEDIWASLRSLNILKNAMIIRTPSHNGGHIPFFSYKPIKTTTLKLDGETIGDLKAEGGQVLLPGSKVDFEKIYSELSAEELAKKRPLEELQAFKDEWNYEIIQFGEIVILEGDYAKEFRKVNILLTSNNTSVRKQNHSGSFAPPFLSLESSFPDPETALTETFNPITGETLIEVFTRFPEHERAAFEPDFNYGKHDISTADFAFAVFLFSEDCMLSREEAAQVFLACRTAKLSRYPNPIEYLNNTINKAYIQNTARSRYDQEEFIAQKAEELPSLTSDFITLKDFPDELPDTPYVLIKGLPRAGKTTRGLQYGIDHGGFTYVVHNHKLGDHILDMIGDMTEGDKTAVHIEGKSNCCLKKGKQKCKCGECPLNPNNGYHDDQATSMGAYEALAKHLFEEYPVLDRGVISKLVRQKYIRKGKYCTYYLLHIAETFADICVTVPQFLCAEGDEPIQQVSPRSMIIFDEDPSCAHFTPNSIPVVTVSRNESFAVEDHITPMMHPALYKVTKFLEAKLNVTQRKMYYDKHMYEICLMLWEVSKNIKMHIKIKEDQNKIPDEDKAKLENNPNYYLDRALEYLAVQSFADELNDEEKAKIIEKLKEYLREENFASNNCKIDTVFEAVLYPHDEIRLSTQSTRQKSETYLIADESKVIRSLPEHDKVLYIGATVAGQFLDSLAGDPSLVTKLYVTKFPYYSNFNFVTFDMRRPRGKPASAIPVLNNLTYDITARNHVKLENMDAPIPAIYCVASKSEQMITYDTLGDTIVSIRDAGLDDIRRRSERTGNTLCVYNNSTLARGQDVEFIHVLLYANPFFKTPFWTALYNQAKDDVSEDWEKVIEYQRIRESIYSDEMTNMVLRIAPVTPDTRHMRKTIFVDEAHIKYLAPSIIENCEFYTFTADDIEEPDNAFYETVQDIIDEESKIQFRVKMGDYYGKVLNARDSRLEELELKKESKVAQNLDASLVEAIKHLFDELGNGGLDMFEDVPYIKSKSLMSLIDKLESVKVDKKLKRSLIPHAKTVGVVSDMPEGFTIPGAHHNVKFIRINVAQCEEYMSRFE